MSKCFRTFIWATFKFSRRPGSLFGAVNIQLIQQVKLIPQEPGPGEFFLCNLLIIMQRKYKIV